MSFKRNDVQEYIEHSVGCYDLSKWRSYQQKLTTWKVDSSNYADLQRCINSDIQSYFFKGYQSFLQAIEEIKQKKYAWSIVKLYYSIFYLLRCDILNSNHFLVRSGALFYSKLTIGSTLTKYQPKRAHGDHQLTIELAHKLYKQGDIIDPLFGNLIDDQTVYSWMMKNRERLNYQSKEFPDPETDIVFSHIKSYFDELKLLDLFKFYNNSKDYSICFDTDHTILAVPYKKLIDTFNSIEDDLPFTNEQKRKISAGLMNVSEVRLDKTDMVYLLNDSRQQT